LGVNVVPSITPNLYVNGKKYIQHQLHLLNLL
jgi:hypothetical protein